MFGYEYEITKEFPAYFLDLEPTRTKEILAEMATDGIIAPEGQNKNRVYRLKQQISVIVPDKIVLIARIVEPNNFYHYLLLAQFSVSPRLPDLRSF